MIKRYAIISILLVLILVLSVLIIDELKPDESMENNASYIEVISNGSGDVGTVEVIRDIGNLDGEKIAYVVGVHPLENQTHKTLLKLLPNVSNLNNSYDIYVINVTQDIGYYGDGSSDDSPGRQNGQNLAYRYVYPEIINGSYDLAIDVHSNVGAYEYQTFVFSPINEGPGNDYAVRLANDCRDISFYAPESTTSGPYLTIPLNENGVPAFYFEEYSFAPQEVKDSHMLELIYAVDNLV